MPLSSATNSRTVVEISPDAYLLGYGGALARLLAAAPWLLGVCRNLADDDTSVRRLAKACADARLSELEAGRG